MDGAGGWAEEVSHGLNEVRNGDGLGQEVVEPGSRILGQLVELAIDSEGNPHLTWFEAVQVSPSLEGVVRYAAGTK